MNFKNALKKCAAVLLACAALAFSACGQKSQPVSAEPVDRDAMVKNIQSLSGEDGQPLLNEAAELDQAELKDVYGIDTSLLQEYVILMDKKWNFVMMLIPAEGKSNDVKNMMSTALTQLSQQLELYEPDQCQVVKDRLETLRGNYLIYVASPDNDKILAEIEAAVG